MRAPPRKHVKPIGAKWLCTGMDEGDQNMEFQFQNGEGGSSQVPYVTPPNQGLSVLGEICGATINSKFPKGGNVGIKQVFEKRAEITPTIQKKESITIETKKKKD